MIIKESFQKRENVCAKYLSVLGNLFKCLYTCFNDFMITNINKEETWNFNSNLIAFNNNSRKS